MMAESSIPGTSEHRSSLDGATSSSRRSNIRDLQVMCLSAIAANFDRFNAAFKMRKSTISPNHIEFLARRFSEKLFNIMKSDRTLKPEYFGFLINPHFKELDLVGIDVDLLPALSHQLKKGNNILSCKTEHPLDDNAYSILISSLQKVETLEFREIESAKIYSAIGNSCTFLKVLKCELPEIGVTQDGCIDGVTDVLKGCPYLEIFQGPDIIGALYRMHQTNMRFARIRKKYVLKNNKKYVLKTLTSSNDQSGEYSLSDALELCAVLCPDTTSLHISHLKKDKELKSCLQFPLLENVTFRRISPDISNGCLSTFLNLTGNRLCSIELPYVSSSLLKHIVKCCPNLHLLSLFNRFLYHQKMVECGKELSCISGLCYLRALKIESIHFGTQTDAEALKSILYLDNSIEKLSLAGCIGLSDELFNSLDLRNVEDLDVSFSDVGTEALKKLLVNGNLQKLNIKKCCVDYYCLTDGQDNDPRIIGHTPAKFRHC